MVSFQLTSSDASSLYSSFGNSQANPTCPHHCFRSAPVYEISDVMMRTPSYGCVLSVPLSLWLAVDGDC